VGNPGTSPPNLAAVSEVAVGMFRVATTVAVPEAELWVDDIRLIGVIDDPGVAAALDVRLAAADVAEVNVAWLRRDDRFRQLGQDASYVTDASTRVGLRFRLDKLLPESWGLAMPFSLQYRRTSSEPYYINRTDVRAEGLDNLRSPEGSATAMQLVLQRSVRGRGVLTHALIDPWSIALSTETARNTTSLSSVTSRNRQARLGYVSSPGELTTPGAPGFLVSLVNVLPSWIRDSEFGKGLATSRFRWNPSQISMQSVLTNNVAERFVYRVPVALPGDTAIRPLPSITHEWRNQFGLDLRPYNSFSVGMNVSSTRDLQDYGDSTTVGRLLEAERRTLLGSDVGFERLRSVSTSITVAPVISAWLRPRYLRTTTFTFNRNPHRQDAVRIEGDSAGPFKVPESVGNSRRQELGATVDLALLGRGIGGQSSLLARVLNGLLPADVSRIVEVRSGYDRVPFSADLGYQLGFGSVDEFRFRDGVPATSTGKVVTTAASGGARLPLALQVRLAYRNLATRTWQRRGDEQAEGQQQSLEWPSISVSWGYTPPAGIRNVLTSVTAQAQYRNQETTQLFPTFSGGDVGEGRQGGRASTENNSTQLTPSLTLGFLAGVTVTGRLTLAESERITSGSTTRSERRDWTGALNFAWRPPVSLIRMRNRIQTTLSFGTSFLGVCIVRTASDECQTVSESRRNQFDFRMDTGFSEMLRGGLTFSYVVSEQRHLSQELSQFIFTVYGNLTLRAGQLR
jgi:hypothetical protein